jgi:hypothetical protein
LEHRIQSSISAAAPGGKEKHLATALWHGSLTRIRRQFVVYFCLHTGQFAGKHCKLARLTVPDAEARQNRRSDKIFATPHRFFCAGRCLRLNSKKGNSNISRRLYGCLLWACTDSASTTTSTAPDGGYPNDNTAEGDSALFSLTNGSENTATGFAALGLNTTGNGNTAVGLSALFLNTTGNYNTALGRDVGHP